MPVLAPDRSDADLVVERAAVMRGGRLLLVRRADWDSLPGRWELPGGKVDDGEADGRAVLRELAEETALTGADEPRLWFEQAVRSPSGRRVAERVYGVGADGQPEVSDEHDRWVWHDPLAPAPGPLTDTAASALLRLAAA